MSINQKRLKRAKGGTMKKLQALFVILFVISFALAIVGGTVSIANAFGNPFYTVEDQQLFMAGLMQNAPGHLDPKGEWKPVKIGDVEVFYKGKIKDFTGKVGEARCYTGCVPVTVASQKKPGEYEYMYYFKVVVVQKITRDNGKPYISQFNYGGKSYTRGDDYEAKHEKNREYNIKEMKNLVDKGYYKF